MPPVQTAYVHSISNTTFSIDQARATKLCAEAGRLLSSGNTSAVESLLIEAICARPSCALAYKLLGDLHTVREQLEAAAVCFRNLLPDGLLRKYFPVAAQNTGCAEYHRHQVFESTSFAIPAARSIDGRSKFNARTTTSEPGFVDTLKSGSLWHDDLNTVVFDNSGTELQQHTVGASGLLRSLCERSKPVSLSGRAVLLGAKGAHNFYHWTTDIVPKIGLLLQSGIDIQPTDKFIVSRADKDFAQQLLSVFHIKPSQIVASETLSPFIAADELVVPYLQNKMGYSMDAWLPRFMKSAMPAAAVAQNGRKLFVNRNAATAAGRVLNNSRQVEGWFMQQGFDVVYPETLSIKEQAGLFSSATVVAGVHGAGLSNIVYCREGTRVIEFYGAHIAPCYWIISALAALEYTQHYCAGQQAHNNRHAAGFELPLAEARDVLLSAGAL